MNPVQFAFWLQGYFEIHGGQPDLTAGQAQQVLEKAQTVKKDSGNEVEAQARSFVDYATGALSVAVESKNDALLASVSQQLRGRLNDLFVHAIDPTIKGDQNHLRGIHRPGDDGGPRAQAMC